MFFSNRNTIKKGKEVLRGLFYFKEDGMLDCNQYILINESHGGEIALFDAGNGISFNGLIKGMEQHSLNYKNITKIFLTHEHVDHCLGVYSILKLFDNKSPKIYAFGDTANILQRGLEHKIFPDNLGISASMFGVSIVPVEVIELDQSSNIKIGDNFEFEIIKTPGHSLGSVTYYDQKNKILIPGDLVFCGGSFGRYDFSGGSLVDLKKSINLVNQLDVKYLLPGHMGISDSGNQQIALSYQMISSLGAYY